jgi:hypothetical protein
MPYILYLYSIIYTMNRYLASAVVYTLILLSFRSNGSTCHNIVIFETKGIAMLFLK